MEHSGETRLGGHVSDADTGKPARARLNASGKNQVASPPVTVAQIIDEARYRLRLTEGCLDCNADDERFWHATIKFLEEFA